MTYVGLAEIAEMLGVSKARAHQLAAEDGFPKPAFSLKMGRAWRRATVEQWAVKNR